MKIVVNHLGHIETFNGVDIDQRCEYIKLHNNTNIDKLILQQEWLQDDTPVHIHPIPMDPSPQH